MVKQVFDKSRIDQSIRYRITRDFMDIIILLEILKSPLSGYDIITTIYRKFNFLISSGTVYSTLYALEREGLIKGVKRDRKRVYVLTRKGEIFIENVLAMQENIENLISKIFGGKYLMYNNV
ncbi:MAG: PadR family transcriptional regulator [Candidatus Bathyarchaeia archaeon]